jgi:hypothetical protein
MTALVVRTVGVRAAQVVCNALVAAALLSARAAVFCATLRGITGARAVPARADQLARAVFSRAAATVLDALVITALLAV